MLLRRGGVGPPADVRARADRGRQPPE